MKFLFKKNYETPESKRFVIAICDAELKGKKINNSIAGTIDPKFYGKEEIEKKELIKKLKKVIADPDLIAINAIGENTIKILVEEGIILEKNVKNINNIPHAIVFYI